MMTGFVWDRVYRFKGPLILISALGILSSITTLALPWLAAQLLGGILDGKTVGLATILVMLIAALVALTAINIISAIATEAAAGRILSGLRTEVYDHVQLLPIEYHDASRHGDLLALMAYEVQRVSGFLAYTLASVPAMLLTAAGAMVVLFAIDPAMALLFPILLPVFFILMKVFGRRLRVTSHKLRAAENDLIGIADTDLAMLPAIKAFAVEDAHSALFGGAAEKARSIALQEARLQSFLAPFVTLIAALSAIALLVVASDRLGGVQQSPDELFAFVLYAALLTRPVGDLADLYGNFRLTSSTLERLEAVFSTRQEPGYQRKAMIAPAKGDIVFENVGFAYSGRPKVFDGFNLTIKAGETIALTGENGAGKSTLVRLLLGLYTPQTGQITLDGKDITDVQVRSLRRQFGYVPQRALLFNGTIADNITFKSSTLKNRPDKAAIDRAVRLSQADSFISELPRGLDTEIGDNGVQLSGGQRQKLALARALLNDPPIYILDEATSMYDLGSEAAFVENCIESLRGKTVMLITHRPASLALADRVVQLDRGTASSGFAG